MKKRVFEKIYKFLVDIINLCNFKKPLILFYTDSRGFNVTSKFGKNPFQSYIKFFLRDYRVHYFICPEKHTTITDFLLKIESLKLDKYKFIIMNCGVVDFSPRPKSNLDWVLSSKKNNKYFQISLKSYPHHYNNLSDILYNNEKTQNLYSKEFLKEEIIAELRKIKGLIWISSNIFVQGWEGNYTKGRPSNIDDLVSNSDQIMETHLKNVVNLRTWKEEDIKKFTIDNIHFNEVGFKEVSKLIKAKINETKFE
jgi:hypothetical protein